MKSGLFTNLPPLPPPVILKPLPCKLQKYLRNNNNNDNNNNTPVPCERYEWGVLKLIFPVGFDVDVLRVRYKVVYGKFI